MKLYLDEEGLVHACQGLDMTHPVFEGYPVLEVDDCLYQAYIEAFWVAYAIEEAIKEQIETEGETSR